MHKPIIIAGALFLALSGSLTATENGGTVYPTGAETVAPGLTPGAGQTELYEFTAFYQASKLMDSHGRNVAPGFHLGIEAAAVKISHNWGRNLLGGSLVTAGAIPLTFFGRRMNDFTRSVSSTAYSIVWRTYAPQSTLLNVVELSGQLGGLGPSNAARVTSSMLASLWARAR